MGLGLATVELERRLDGGRGSVFLAGDLTRAVMFIAASLRAEKSQSRILP